MLIDDLARDKKNLVFRLLPRSLQKFLLRFCPPQLILTICIIFFLILLPLILRGSNSVLTVGPNALFTLDPRYRVIVREAVSNPHFYNSLAYRRKLLHSFTPYIMDDENKCINRSVYRTEHVRILGLDPYRDDLSLGRTLVIGKNTPLGHSIIKKLNYSKTPHIALGCRENIDLSAPDALGLLDLVNITRVIFTCGVVFPKGSRTDGYRHITNQMGHYFSRIGEKMKSSGIPIIYAVENHLPDNLAQSVLKTESKAIVFPTLLSPNSQFSRTGTECLVAKRTKVEFFPEFPLSDITSDIAADFTLKQFSMDSGPLIKVLPNSILPIKQALESLTKVCDIEFTESKHVIPPNRKTFNETTLPSSASIEEETRLSLVYPKPTKPYLSIVFVGRHDNFSKGFEERTRESIKSIAEGLKLHPLASIEVVFVDYATPDNNTKLHEVMEIPPLLKGKVRFVNIPEKVHLKIQQRMKSNLAFFEYIAKNAGIRYAQGDFILVSNPDNLFPSTFHQIIAERDLNPFILYRGKRWDTREATLKEHSRESLTLTLAEEWMPLPNTTYERCYLGPHRFVIFDSVQKYKDYSFPCGSGDFFMMSSSMWQASGGFNEYPANPSVDACFNAKMMKMIPGYARQAISTRILHQWHPKKNVFRKSIEKPEVVMEEYACQGESPQLGEYNDNPKWGLASHNFEVVVR